MITVYNKDYKDQYTTLFDEAYNVLMDMHAADPLGVQISDSVKNNGKISTLEEYFAHIGYLADYHTDNVQNNPPSNVTYQNSAKFLMLPMDEKHNSDDGDCFYIDLNSRNIKTPNSYVKNGVSVTGDQLAETLMFKVPRYFDYTDLASTEIYIQWTNPAGQEGASRIVLVDFEAEEGYVLFGWPLTNKITVEGKNPLKFSVRFFVRDEEKQIKYSLNTLPASVNIKQALYTNFNANLDIDDPSLLFAVAVRNGVDTNMTLPKIPAFFADWDLPVKMSLTDDTLQMMTSGASDDTGLICYKWYYYPRYVEDNKVVTQEQEGPYKMYAGVDTTYVPTRDTEREAGKTYYVEEMEAETGRKIYTIHDGPFAEVDEGETAPIYYEEVSVYTIYASGIEADKIPSLNAKYWPHITGEYKVILTNKVGSNEPVEGEYAQKCVIPCIEEIKFTTNLSKNKVLEKIGEGDEATHQTILTVAFSANEDNIEKSYKWYKAATENGEYVAIEGSNPGLTVSEPGWYRAEAIGSLNREVMTELSEKCKVTYPAVAPVINQYLVDGIKYPIVDDDPVLESIPGLNKNITFKVDIEELGEFETDGVVYEWFRNTPDQNGTPVKDTDLDIVNINGPEITVKLLANDALPVNMAFYYCQITNNLADESKTTVSKVFQIS